MNAGTPARGRLDAEDAVGDVEAGVGTHDPAVPECVRHLLGARVALAETRVREDRDRHVAPAAGRCMDVDGPVAGLHHLEQGRGEPLGEIAVTRPREAGPRVGRGLVQRRLHELRDGQAVVGVERERVLHRHADDAAAQALRVHLGEGAEEYSDAVDLVAVDGGAEVEPRPGMRAVDQVERNRDPGAVGELGELDRVAPPGARWDRDAGDIERGHVESLLSCGAPGESGPSGRS